MRQLWIPTLLLLAAGCGQPKPDQPAQAVEPVAPSSNAQTAVAPTPAPAPAASPFAAFVAGSWQAFGTEPFWTINVVPGKDLAFLVQGEDGGFTAPFKAPVQNPDGSYTVQSGDIKMVITEKTCIVSEGNERPYSVKLTLGTDESTASEGCAEPIPSQP
jgi:uncharacterized membrane protein